MRNEKRFVAVVAALTLAGGMLLVPTTARVAGAAEWASADASRKECRADVKRTKKECQAVAKALSDAERGAALRQCSRRASNVGKVCSARARMRSAALVSAASARAAGDAVSEALITTDRRDYSPGDSVVVGGIGFLPGETVSIVITTQTHDPESFESVVDENGQFLNAGYVVWVEDLDTVITATATGQTSGAVAQTAFTDSNPNAPEPPPACSTGSLDEPTPSLGALNPTHWKTQAGTTITGTISGATDVASFGNGSCATGQVEVIIKSSAFGNTTVCGTVSDTTISFSWSIPATGVCLTTAVAYGTNGHNADRCGSSRFGFAIVDASGTVITDCNADPCAGVTCTALDQCHLPGTCTNGVCSNPPNEGADCDSGNVCRPGTCDGTGTCVPGPGICTCNCTYDPQCQSPGTCDLNTGICSDPVNLPPETLCDADHSLCTVGDHCSGSGVCVAGPAVVCTALDQCHVPGICEPSTGLCSNPNAPNGTPCNDGNPCLTIDTCQEGVCIGSAPYDCTPNNTHCHTYACDETPESGDLINPNCDIDTHLCGNLVVCKTNAQGNPLSGWSMTAGGPDTVTGGVTGAGGCVSLNSASNTGNDSGVLVGTYSATEANRLGWVNVFPSNPVCSPATCPLPTILGISVPLDGTGTATFQNQCVASGGGLTLGYWSNKNGQARITAANLLQLRSLNLRNANGSDFDPTTAKTLATWLLNATATNMAYMLSAQLATMELNVLNGGVNGNAVVFAGTPPAGCTVPGMGSGAFAGYIGINDLMNDANSAATFNLSNSPITKASGAARSCEEFMKTALDMANNNANFYGQVCP